MSTVIRRGGSGPNAIITNGLATVLAGNLPDANTILDGVEGSNVVWYTDTFTAPRVFTLAAGTATEGDKITVVSSELATPILFGGYALFASDGVQSLEFTFVSGAFVLTGGGTDTQGSGGSALYFGQFADPLIPAAPASFEVGFLTLDVVGDNRWLFQIDLHSQGGASDTVLTFNIELESTGGGPRVDITGDWDEYFAPESGEYSRTIQVNTIDSGGVADGQYYAFLVCTVNAGGVDVQLSYPSNMLAQALPAPG